MNRKILTTALAALAAPAVCFSAIAQPAQGSGVAWDIVEGLTTLGPRIAGSPAEERARAWSKARLEALGFSNVRVEEFRTTAWARGEDRARLTSPYPQNLAIAALGFSAPTPVKGIEGELVYFPTLQALRDAPAGSLKGKIAFVDHAMRRAQDGAGYGPYGDVRRSGPGIASAKGAAGIVIRSVGTDSHRNPHTGATVFPKDVTPIPSGAVSNPDADLIARVAKRGKPMRIALTLTGKTNPNAPSGNLIADLPGRDPSLPLVLLGCHLDSWDLGTGAIDDASGCGIVTEAALAAHKAGALRTIRVLWAGNEEMGFVDGGGRRYAEAHAAEPHALAMESDFGADRVWRFRHNLGDATASPVAARIAAALWPMGIVFGADSPSGGADVAPIIAAQKLAVVDLDQDGTKYFDLHHTPDDTLDKVDPAALAQNVAAWTAVLNVVANEAGPLTPVATAAGH